MLHQEIKDNTLDYALQLDKEDALKAYRERFYFPLQENGNPYIYFCGNSLGLQPKHTRNVMEEVITAWEKRAVEGHFKGDNPWMFYHEYIVQQMAKIVGAKPIEVTVMNTLTTNLHLLMVSFYRPSAKRYKILMESDAFPSDRYALVSQIKFHGYDPKDALLELKPRTGETIIRTEDILTVLEQQGNEIALVLIGGINYYTGQLFDIKTITQKGHEKGCVVGFDLAHAAGNVNLNLHDDQVDFAAWCSYKYLNSGPGSLSGCFVHERFAHDKSLPRFAGWWGHNPETRFLMPNTFDPAPGAEGWVNSNAPMLSLAAIKASMQIFEELSMKQLLNKSHQLTGYLEHLILQLKNERIEIITPSNPQERGCQLSIRVKGSGKALFHKIHSRGVIGDWREPDVIRISPTPLYNSFADVWKFVQILKDCLLED